MTNHDNLIALRAVLKRPAPAGRRTLGRSARLLALPPRTLQRRLQRAGLTYSQVVDEVRFELARELLDNSALTIQRVAAILGYSDASNFSRAFRRWSGLSPTEYRRARLDRGRTAPEGERREERRGGVK